MGSLRGFAASLFLFTVCMEVISQGVAAEVLYAVAGSARYTLAPAEYKTSPKDRLIWKRDGKVVYNSMTPKDNNKYQMRQKGLELPAEALSQAGQLSVYHLEVHGTDGNERFKWTVSLSVLEEVRTPNLTPICVGQNVVFQCIVPPPPTAALHTNHQMKVLGFAWSVNNITQTREKGANFTPALTDSKESITCTVFNNASRKQSLPATANCMIISRITEWITMNSHYVGAGSGGLLLLTVVLIVLCCVQAKRRRRKREQMEREFRLNLVNQAPKPDAQQKQRPKKKKRRQPPPDGSQPQRCKSGGDHHRAKDPFSVPPGGQGHPPIPANPPRPRPSPRRPAQEKDTMAVGDQEYCPPLPKPRKKAPKTNSDARVRVLPH